jgi:hypothetical protein
LIIDPSFELHHPAWYINPTTYLASYATEHVHEGQWAMRAGIAWGSDIYSFSSFQQTLTLPQLDSDDRMYLSFWYYRMTGDNTGDRQYVLIMRSPDDFVYVMYNELGNEQQWLRWYDWSLKPWAGQTVTIRFGVLNDGDGKLTAMYIDDVKVNVERRGGSTANMPLADRLNE